VPGNGFFYGYIVVAAAALVLFVFSSNLFVFGIFFKPMVNEFGWSRALTSGAFSLAWVVRGALGIIMGSLNDRLGPRLLATVCGIMMGAGYLLMAQVHSVWQFYLFYVGIIGIGSGLYVPMVSTVARWFTNRRGLMTGLVVAGGGLGALVSPPLADLLITTYDWRISYVIFGCAALVIIVAADQFLRRDPEQKGLVPYGEIKRTEGELDSGRRGLSLKGAVCTRQYWLLNWVLFCIGYCAHTIAVHIVPHATDMGISSANAAIILAMVGGMPILGRIVHGTSADRIGYKRGIMIGMSLVSACLLWLIFAGETWMLYVFAVVFGLSWCVGMLSSPLIAELFGLKSHGAIMGLTTISYSAGAAVGPYIAGHIFDVTGSYQIAFMLITVIAVSGLVITALITPTEFEKQEKALIDSEVGAY